MADRIQLRRDTAANWTAYNPILLEGEPGIEIDTDQWKLGDGIHTWSDLPYRGGPYVQQRGQSTTAAMSQKAVTDELNLIAVFDISAYNLTNSQPTKYANLTAALGTHGDNIPNVPTQYRVPGMTVKYISLDNEYMQYRLKATAWSTDADDWECITEVPIDEVPTLNSDNLVKSGGVHAAIGAASNGVISLLSSQLGYYVCDTSAANAAKTVSSSNYTLSVGGSIKIKMTNANTAASGVTLKIGNAEAKPLYYAGQAVSASNTWQAGETVEVYYDGTNYCANSVAGGGSGDGGDGVFDISEYNSGAKYASLAAALAAVPASVQRGGMSVKYVDSTSNEYVQYWLKATAWSNVVTDWADISLSDGCYCVNPDRFSISENKLNIERTYIIFNKVYYYSANKVTLDLSSLDIDYDYVIYFDGSNYSLARYNLTQSYKNKNLGVIGLVRRTSSNSYKLYLNTFSEQPQLSNEQQVCYCASTERMQINQNGLFNISNTNLVIYDKILYITGSYQVDFSPSSYSIGFHIVYFDKTNYHILKWQDMSTAPSDWAILAIVDKGAGYYNLYINTFAKQNATTGENILYPTISSFQKIGVIGDSFASGWLYVSGTGENWYKSSWIQQMARQNGVIGINFSKGGLTTRTWLTDDMGLSRLNSQDACDLYYIALGINDRDLYGDSYLGTVADCSGDDPTQYADTFCGNMGRIIKAIQAKAPYAKIIISTLASPRGGNGWNDAMIAIANRFSIVYIVQDEDPFFLSSYYKNNFVTNHPTVQLYGGMAKAIERLTLQCMLNNQTYFNDIHPTEQ